MMFFELQMSGCRIKRQRKTDPKPYEAFDSSAREASTRYSVLDI